MVNNIEELIKEKHQGDKCQLDIIFSDDKRMVVEAPAGCGKTTTMVSKVAYMLAKNKVQKNKKILALTFSVNASYKMKKDVFEKLPLLNLDQIKTPADLNRLITISNYHGLARRILALYGYLLDERLKNIDLFQSFNETDYRADEIMSDLKIDLTQEEKETIKSFGEATSLCNFEKIEKLQNAYNEILLKRMLPLNCITFNGYLTLVRKLLSEHAELLKFYQKLFPVIIIDEFQDTNILSWSFIKLLITENSELFFMGDSLQRIYGFIGAIPNLLNHTKEEFLMTGRMLEKNYRFRDNQNMLLLDKNIRKNAQNVFSPSIEKSSSIELHLADTQENECLWLVDKIGSLLDKGKCAVLVQQRSENINMLLNELEERSISYFYALFSEEDNEYIEYHHKASSIFFEELNVSKNNRVNKSMLNKVFLEIKNNYANNTSKVIESLLTLTRVFFDRICTEYLFLENEDKIVYISDTLRNRALKQNMDLVDSDLFVSTVHGAKGLEWDNVIIPDLEPYIFPNFPSLCGECTDAGARIQDYTCCKMNVCKQNIEKLLDELSVFYVAVTRAKKQLFFSASLTRYNANKKCMQSKISCLGFLPGISIKYI